MEIRSINHRDDLLHHVIALADKNKQTLGMFPAGAFHQHARNKSIIVAVIEGQLAGYLLFRISQRKRLVSVTHLCVSNEFKGQGIANSLLHDLKLRYQNIFSGITLTCRADYKHASRLWETFGFKARSRKRSKATTGEYYLIRWMYDFGNPNLFSDPSSDSKKLKAVLDSSIIIPLSEIETSTDSEVSALNANWLEDEVEYACTQEVFNEINRDVNLVRAQTTREFVKRFEVLNFKPDRRDQLVLELNTFFPGNTTNDVSDRKQLAECIASGCLYFITRDKELLDQSEKLHDKYGLEVLRPVEFIILVDELANSLDYRSYRLAGANYDSSKLRTEDIEKLINHFSGMVTNEKIRDLEDVVTRCVSGVKKGHVRIIKDKTENPIAVYGVTFDTIQLTIELIRVKRSHISTVLFQQLIRDIILFSLEQKFKLIIINEANISEEQKSTLLTMGFIFAGNRWQKLSLIGVATLSSALNDPEIVKHFDTTEIAAAIKGALAKDWAWIDLERKLWPLKFKDLDVPVYIIPIRPLWASQLFDFYLADVSLFGALASLAWSRENIYYRSVKPVTEKAPGRILWYVSSEERTIGRSKGIVATSYLDEVYIDRAKDIFRKYKRFGVYEWSDIYKLANGEILSEIKALKFSDTEVFKNIVPLTKINAIMSKHSRPKNTFPSPVEVSIDIFNEIYQLGKNE